MLEDDELLELKKILKIGGYQTYKTAFFDSDNYKKLRTIFLDNLPHFNIPYPTIHFCSLDKVKQAGTTVIQKHTNGIDIKIPYTFEDDLMSSLIEVFGERPEENKIEDIIAFIKNNIELKKVTDIPILLNLSEEQNGRTFYASFYSHFQNLKYYELLPNIINEIKLEGASNDFSKGIYVHEMYHALSQRNKGYTNNYLYEEVLPLFMENVTALDLDPKLLEPYTLKNLLEMKDDIINLTSSQFYEENYKNIIEPQKYILSNIMVSALFNVYLHSSNRGQKQINDEINKVLMGTQQLEDVFNKYEITTEKGTNIIKKQVKTLTKTLLHSL